MWINAMLTIWLWGTIGSLLLIGFSLWNWYWRDDGGSRQVHASDRRASSRERDKR